ncbi:MAG: SMC-Scp complex subunit ScpB [Oligoflexia bacterium]|nr:SMC-Scp complex subunit ScpB [Oligoflexia bacterium]
MNFNEIVDNSISMNIGTDAVNINTVVNATTMSSTVESIGLELDNDSLCGAIEALLFVSDKPLSILKLKETINDQLPLIAFHSAILRLQEEYEKSNHGIRLVEVAGGYQFRTKALFSKYIQRVFKTTTLMLGPTALEVLAVVAYRGPVSRLEIDRIRGVDSSHIIRALLDKKLIKIVKRAEDLGRQTLYGVSDLFFEMFSLKKLSDLPPEHELESIALTNEIGSGNDLRSLIAGGALKTYFLESDLSELDELTKTIKSISADTDFTRTMNKSRQDERRALQVKEKEQQQQSPSQSPSEPAAAATAAEIQELQPLQQPQTLQPPKSAFDILEEFVVKNEIVEQNKASLSCNLLPTDIYNFLFDIKVKVEVEEAVEEVKVKEVEEIEEIEEVEEVDQVDQVDQVEKVEEVEEKENYWFSDDLVDDEPFSPDNKDSSSELESEDELL